MSRPALELIPGGRESRAPGDPLSLKALYSKYGAAVFGRCLFLLKDRSRAEDAMQDVFARALTSGDTFRGEASPVTWLMKIATHHCLNELRAERAPWRRLFRRDEEARGEGHGGVPVMEARDALRRVLSKFDPETQAAVIHYHLDGLTLEEVAALLSRSVPTIRKRLEAFKAEAAGDAQP